MKFRFAISISAAALLFSALLNIEVNAQVCGYSVNTFIVVDDSGAPIDYVKIEPVSSESYKPHFREHFEEASKIYRTNELNAYVVQHGLCGPHRGVVLRFSADGFEPAEYKLEMPHGFRGYVIKLKKKGNQEKAAMSEIDCAEQPTRCVMTLRSIIEK